MNYDELAQVALALIKDAGKNLPMTRNVGGTYDPVAGITTGGTVSTQTLAAVVLPATLRRMLGLDNSLLEGGGLVLSKARYVLAAAVGSTYEPDAEDIITFDGIDWRVIACVPLKPADVALVYKMGVMRA